MTWVARARAAGEPSPSGAAGSACHPVAVADRDARSAKTRPAPVAKMSARFSNRRRRSGSNAATVPVCHHVRVLRRRRARRNGDEANGSTASRNTTTSRHTARIDHRAPLAVVPAARQEGGLHTEIDRSEGQRGASEQGRKNIAICIGTARQAKSPLVQFRSRGVLTGPRGRFAEQTAAAASPAPRPATRGAAFAIAVARDDRARRSRRAGRAPTGLLRIVSSAAPTRTSVA